MLQLSRIFTLTDWFPCLALDSLHSHRDRRRQYKDAMDVLSKTDSDRAGWKIHCERSLDEAYYPALSESDLTKRNDDQAVSRCYNRKYQQGASTDNKRSPILMVSQLWLLGAGRVIVSASSMSTGSDMYRGLDPAKRYVEFAWNDLNPPDDSAAPPE
jgi:hypothetical protein